LLKKQVTTNAKTINKDIWVSNVVSDFDICIYVTSPILSNVNDKKATYSCSPGENF